MTQILQDLGDSGLVPSDIAARPLTSAELAATGIHQASTQVDGYVIPYFNLRGDAIPYYRVKILGGVGGGLKYKAIKGSQNHIYFPPGLQKLLRPLTRSGDDGPGHSRFIIITEGEKKAACAVKHGFPAVAVSGVDNWRNRQIILPENTELVANKISGTIHAKIPSGDSNAMVVQDSGVVAVGFHDLVDFLVEYNLEAIIVYDTDKDGGLKPEVQRAAAQLGYELRYRGLPVNRIRQLVLPAGKGGSKMGLDDYLMSFGTKNFAALIRNVRGKRIAFPRHPNPKVYVSSRLQKARLSRKESQDVALSILMELEGKGRRLRNKATQDVFFFDEASHKLMTVALGNPRVMLHETTFGSYLYQEFNLSATDAKIIGWLAAQFHGEPGIEDTTTHKVLARPKSKPGCIAYQLSDSHFIIVTPDPGRPYIVCENGEYGVLFEQGQVEPISHVDIEAEIEHAFDEIQERNILWPKVMKDFNFAPSSPAVEGSDQNSLSPEESQRLATLLFYLSPWFLKWQGTQLPVEITIGEPGSGKSSLYELRQMVITGAPRLANMTNDVKDWYASITSYGGLHVMDNVHFTGANKDYAQRLSDELCRLVTDPKPHVELRKLYTTSDIVSLPVDVAFAITAVEQPFFRTDLIQRAAIFELQQISGGHNADWVGAQLRRGRGRIGWVAHHLAVIHKFLHRTLLDGGWDTHYRAGHRLANYEQALINMAHVLGIPYDWIPEALARATAVKTSETDWTISGLQAFAEYWRKQYKTARFTTSEIVAWAELQDNYDKNQQLTNAWRLGRYLKSHRGALQKTLGLYSAGTKANKAVYELREPRT